MHRIDGAGHVDHMFVAEDPATFRPPTEITPEIMNAFQEELALFIEWAGIVLAKGDNTQMKQALLAKFALLDSPEFVGNPKAPTAALADSDTTLANTEFVHLVVAAALAGLGLGNYALLAAAQTFTKGQRGIPVALPATTGAVSLDLDLGNNWEGTLTGNITLANPSHIVPGQSGVIRIVNDATPRTIAYGSYWKAASGAFPALTAVAGATDLLGYYVETPTRIWIGAQGDSK